jgi:hypothetical protein
MRWRNTSAPDRRDHLGAMPNRALENSDTPTRHESYATAASTRLNGGCGAGSSGVPASEPVPSPGWFCPHLPPRQNLMQVF